MNSWVHDPEYSSWLREVDGDTQRALCCLCKKSFDIANMGIAAVKSHMKGKKHSSLATESTPSAVNYFARTPATSLSQDRPILENNPPKLMSATLDSSVTSSSHSACNTLNAVISKDDVLRAEIIWALKVVTSHYSLNSCTDIGQCFRIMFPDSDVAKKFTCGATKCSYLVCFGLAPFFIEVLTDAVRAADCFSVSFDESMNRVTQKEQMDLHVRFWDKDKVVTRYLGSQFLGHTRAVDLLAAFREGIGGLNSKNLLQISMDGPNVNWRFYEDFSSERRLSDPEFPMLLNIGSCGLHTLHNAFRRGAEVTLWKIGHVLSSLWYLFNDTPARRDDFYQLTKSSVFPLKFCQHRWLEDAPVAERALEVLPCVKEYLLKLQGKPSKEPKAASFQAVKSACKDPLLVPKLQFFISVANQVKPFLEKFQTDAPAVPFLFTELEALVSGLMQRFVFREKLETSKVELHKIDPKDKKLHLSANDVDIGFAARKSIRDSVKAKDISGLKEMEFRSECQSFLAETTARILIKCPLKYPLVKHLVSLDPNYMVSCPEASVKSFERVLEILIERKWKSSNDCDSLLVSYKAFVNEMKLENYHAFNDFSFGNQERVDTFLMKFAANKYASLFRVFKILLTLSHGQASIERGYSVNKELLVENLSERSIVAQRIICDSYASSDSSVMDIEVTPDLRRHTTSARMRYSNYLEEKSKSEINVSQRNKRKVVEAELVDAEKKKKKLEHSVLCLETEASSLAVSAEAKHDFNLLSKSNALRQKASEHGKTLKALVSEIDELKLKLKKIS